MELCGLTRRLLGGLVAIIHQRIHPSVQSKPQRMTSSSANTIDAWWTMGEMSDEIAHTLGSLHCRFHSCRISSESTDKIISLTSKSKPRRHKHISKLAPKLTH